MAVSQVCFAQSSQQEKTPAIDLARLLAEGGYKYIEVKKGLWRIPEMVYEGKNLKKIDLFLEPEPHNKSLRISLRLGASYNSAESADFKEKLNDLNKRFKPTEFLLSKTTLFAVTDLFGDKLDKKMLALEILRLADAADQAQPELVKFIASDTKESTGPGSGGGMGMGAGVGPGYNPSAYNTPRSSETNTVKSVDSRPQALNRVTPGYTDEARNNKVQGIVRLRILVDETGNVKDVRVTIGLPDGLTEKAMEAARKMQFKPAMKDGKPVAFWMPIEVTFYLR
jgi:TonB family protein